MSQPDLAFVTLGRWVGVGDCKYKTWAAGEHIHADLYQVIAYCVAAGLNHGILIYPAYEDRKDECVWIANSSIQIHILSLDLAEPGNRLEQASLRLALRVRVLLEGAMSGGDEVSSVA